MDVRVIILIFASPVYYIDNTYVKCYLSYQHYVLNFEITCLLLQKMSNKPTYKTKKNFLTLIDLSSLLKGITEVRNTRCLIPMYYNIQSNPIQYCIMLYK